MNKNFIISYFFLALCLGAPYFDSEKSFEYLLKQCEIGYRYPGSNGQIEFKEYLVDFLSNQSDSVLVDSHRISHPYIKDKEIDLYNIFARYNLTASRRILFMAHWDTREIADKDPNKENYNTPIMGANDGASGVAVLMSLAEILHSNPLNNIGVDLLFVDGEDITNLNPSKIVEKGIAQVMEGRRIFSELSVIENLRLGGHTNSANIQNNIDRVLDMFPALKDRQKGEAGYLSGGEQQMLAIGRALMSEPEYLLLDEPSLGLAPKLVDQISDLIQEINKQGVTVLLVEQNANMALNISDHGYIMETGNIVMDNDSQKLLNDEDVREFYLGLNAEGTKRKSFKDVKHYKRKKRWLS